MNTFKRITAAVALSTAFFAHNVQAAPTDAVCVLMGSLGGAIVDAKRVGLTESKAIAMQDDIANKAARDSVVKMVRYIYLDDGKYVDAKYLYLKCKVGDFD